MFDKFGEFDSYIEINKAAAGQKEEGDEAALKDLAKENGIDLADAEDYFDGAIQELCTPLIAAIGKLDIEEADLKPKDIMKDWTDYIRTQIADSEEMQLAIRKKGKSLKGCIAALLKWSFDHQHTVDNEIKRAAGVTAGKVTLGIPGMANAHKIIRDYYLGR
ncbi:MAG: hypothetical protein J6Y57_01025 [Lachnospiraceae bacterium]|nr:hypothetical protein [Lachnospiraceae bacterium]